MESVDVPFFGTLAICAAMVVAAYTFAVALAAGRGRPQLLASARWGTYATAALVAVAIFLLAYAFQTHDFRIRYVARYSDRSMEWWYLVASLWGGQDGSLLWWAFLLCGWTVACTRWMRGRFAELQPWVLATLSAILLFFFVLMLFAANPFATTPSITPPDGEGLNPLLQNYWMTIHPPALYMGFIGWSIPFAFCIAALVTGRLHDEWLHASRRWMLASWLFLSVGLILGMLWSYEELGWGGYWAWDPVENASFMPWLVGTAFLHSVMIQERYGMLRVWNVFLMCLTFFMTIFGTFLTRAGLISSVHSFAKSDIGIYFVVAMLFLLIFCFGLIGWRTPELRAVHRIQSLASREFAFLLNNWIFLAIMFLVLVLTTFPLITELFMNEKVTMGPPVFNRFLVPFGIVLLVLSGVGPLIAWRKATGRNLVRAFTFPTTVAVVIGGLHAAIGDALGFAAWVDTQPIYETATGDVLRGLFGASPVFASVACAFVIATILQEFWRGTSVRIKNRKEPPVTALIRLVSKAKRRYGGYIVHLGIVLCYVGFAGSCYDVEKEAALRPGETMEVGADGLMRGAYVFRYERARTEADTNKTALYADLTVLNAAGDPLDEVAPAKFIYRTAQEMATTEVAIRSRPIEDLYIILSTVDSQSQRATFRIIVRPLVMWIWIGGIVLILGTLISMAPTMREILGDGRVLSLRRTAAAITLAVLLMPLMLLPAVVRAQDSSSLHAGHVSIEDEQERGLFERLLCMCGDCQRLSLATCGCGWADNMRAEVRGRLARGDEPGTIENDYRERFGAQALSIPPDSGLTRAAWAIPVVGSMAAIGLVIGVGLAWRRRGRDDETHSGEGEAGDDYDRAIDEELERMEGDS